MRGMSIHFDVMRTLKEVGFTGFMITDHGAEDGRRHGLGAPRQSLCNRLYDGDAGDGRPLGGLAIRSRQARSNENSRHFWLPKCNGQRYN